MPPHCNPQLQASMHISIPGVSYYMSHLRSVRSWLWAKGSRHDSVELTGPEIGVEAELCEGIHYKVHQWLTPHCHHFSVMPHPVPQRQATLRADPKGNILRPFRKLWL